MTPNPIVSVVIPTYNRPDLVGRAVKSAFAQTITDIEVIVVTDGPDAPTETALSKIADPRLKIFSLPTHQGANAARNKGIAESQAEWIALLDDDDEWLSTKLEEQLAVALKSKYKYPIVTCFVLTRSLEKEKVWSTRLPKATEPLSEFVCISTPFRKKGLITTSTIFAKKTFFKEVAFDENLSQYQDLDWLLRAIVMPQADVEFVAKALSVWHVEEKRGRTSSTYDWRGLLMWAHRCRHLITPRAYAGIVLGSIASHSLAIRDWKAFFLLLREAIVFGKPSLMLLLAYFYKWFIPESIRRQARSFKECVGEFLPRLFFWEARRK